MGRKITGYYESDDAIDYMQFRTFETAALKFFRDLTPFRIDFKQDHSDKNRISTQAIYEFPEQGGTATVSLRCTNFHNKGNMGAGILLTGSPNFWEGYDDIASKVVDFLRSQHMKIEENHIVSVSGLEIAAVGI